MNELENVLFQSNLEEQEAQHAIQISIASAIIMAQLLLQKKSPSANAAMKIMDSITNAIAFLNYESKEDIHTIIK